MNPTNNNIDHAPEEETAGEELIDQDNPELQSDAEGESEVEDLKTKVSELEDTILRMAAENQNTRKRLVKQQQDAHRYRHQDILGDLANTIDNFERAIDSAKDSRDFDAFYEGIVMIEKQFSGMLMEKYGLERIGMEGKPFDPSAHEAVFMEESPDVEEDMIKQVYQAGYSLHDRVLRPAKVVVLKPAEQPVNSKVEDTAVDSEET